jgi:Flp pilus assembly protein TadD
MEFGSIVVVAMMVLFVAAVVKARRRRRTHMGGPGSGATGAIYDMLNEDKRKAIEIIVEEKAEARDPETADGNLPLLERPK